MIVATSRSAEEPLALATLPSRSLEPGEVRVKVRAIGVNPVDWKMRAGGPLRFAHRFVGPFGPLVVGVDFAGDVVEIGDRVQELAVGDRVVGGTDFSRGQLGSYADEVVVQPDQCARLPDGVAYEDAASLPVAAVTPWISLVEHGKLGKGDRVLVLGASGGVGLFCLSLAKMLGGKAVGVCSKKNVPMVERHGAIAIDYGAGDALDAAKEHGPYDVVFNAVGSEAYPLDRCRALLSKKGFVELVMPNAADMIGLATSRQVKTVLGRVTKARMQPLVDALARGDLRPVIQERFALADAERAHALSRSGKVVGKLLLIPEA
jgi:NADPH:quinone reductase-like Zn-dependent oxidoreductase